MDLDLQAAQAVVKARLLERAVNDRGPWTVTIGGTTIAAVRVVSPDAVRFLLNFDEVPDGDVAWLACRGEELTSWDLTGRLPESGAFTLEWKISPEPVLV